jgi:hypothetical protein
MRLSFTARPRPEVAVPATAVRNPHEITSDYLMATCRFVVSCTCGASLETRYIDEALEWRQLHQELGPLVDQLPR